MSKNRPDWMRLAEPILEHPQAIRDMITTEARRIFAREASARVIAPFSLDTEEMAQRLRASLDGGR